MREYGIRKAEGSMKTKMMTSSFSPEHSDYRTFLVTVRKLVDSARYHVYRTASNAQVQLYWTIGEGIVRLQDKHGWGNAVVENLARDLATSFPDSISFSSRNLWLMRQLFTEYRDSTKKLKQLVSEVPWGQNILIMQKAAKEFKKP